MVTPWLYDLVTLGEALQGFNTVRVIDPKRPWELVERPASDLDHRGPGEPMVLLDGDRVLEPVSHRVICHRVR